MGEAAASHLTGVLRIHPSIFEVISQENFGRALYPAIKHVIRFLAQKNPEVFGGAYRHFSELYLAFDSILHFHYLTSKGGTLSESFYGLERRPLEELNENEDNKTTSQIPISQKKKLLFLSIISAVVLPYLRGKLKEKSRDHIANHNQQDSSWKDKFLRNYSLLLGLFDSITIIYYILYSFGKIKTHSPIFHILKLRLDYTNTEADQPKPSILESWKNIQTFKSIPRLLLTSFGESFLFAVEIGSFFVQFLDWWNSSQDRRAISISSLPIPKPYSNGLKLDKIKCPLCSQERQNPTALSTSGIVYCYSCITRFLKHENKCPVTGIPSTSDQLIRIFD